MSRMLRIQFLVIALSLAITTTVLGLSAYLTDTDTYEGTFKTIGGDALGFKLTGKEHKDEVVVPGSTVTLDVKASVNQPNDLFLFVELDIPADFSMEGFNSNSWHPIKSGSNIYYYGNNTRCIALGTVNGNASPVLSGITLSPDAKGDVSYSVTITGYAIQATNIDADNTSPEQIFNMIGADQNGEP